MSERRANSEQTLKGTGWAVLNVDSMKNANIVETEAQYAQWTQDKRFVRNNSGSIIPLLHQHEYNTDQTQPKRK